MQGSSVSSAVLADRKPQVSLEICETDWRHRCSQAILRRLQSSDPSVFELLQTFGLRLESPSLENPVSRP